MKILKHILILLTFILLFSCSNSTNNDCHKCKGGSPQFYVRLDNEIRNNQISYNEYAKLLQRAENCPNIVCGKSLYCIEHLF